MCIRDSSSCTICPEGYFADANSLSPSCTQCAPGSISGEGATECGVCTPGRYSAVDVCKNCPKGYYTDINGLPACKGCTPGKYQENIESTSCKECSVGRYDTLPNFVGFKNTILTFDCTEICQPSQYQDETGKTSCKSCGTDKISFVYAADSVETCMDCLLPIFTPIRI